jgi:hypothetical protein
LAEGKPLEMPVRDDKGQVMRWYVACTDIEDRKRAEKRLHQENADLKRAEERIREQEAELRQMLDLTPTQTTGNASWAN